MPPDEPPIYFRAVASRGAAAPCDGFSDPVVFDLAGFTTTGDIPLLLAHARFAVCGRAFLELIDKELVAWGVLLRDRWPGQAVLGALAGGIEWACSIGVAKDGFEYEHITDGPTVWFNKKGYARPIVAVRKFRVAEISLTLNPAESGTSVVFGGRLASPDEAANVSNSKNPCIPPRMAGRSSKQKELRPMDPVFHDHRGQPWRIDLRSAPAADMATKILKLAAEPEGFMTLLTRPDVLAAVIPILARGPDGEFGSCDSGFMAWLSNPEGDWYEKVVGALAEAVVASYRYDARVVALVGHATAIALGDIDPTVPVFAEPVALELEDQAATMPGWSRCYIDPTVPEAAEPDTVFAEPDPAEPDTAEPDTDEPSASSIMVQGRCAALPADGSGAIR
jgi:hypothetical protein